jgi:aspartate/methionine/tyrosine aminotransferase
VVGTGLDERELADGLLERAGVALLPGSAFGPAGEGFLRLAYTQSEADLRVGLERMANHLAERVAVRNSP